MAKEGSLVVVKGSESSFTCMGIRPLDGQSGDVPSLPVLDLLQAKNWLRETLDLESVTGPELDPTDERALVVFAADRVRSQPTRNSRPCDPRT